MTRYFAFLRAINVGGHTVKMDDLRRLFEDLGFGSVETFIASGNVVFETDLGDLAALEEMIESRLGKQLGYGVAVFLRTQAELAALVAYRPFPAEQLAAAAALNIAFMKAPLDAGTEHKLLALRNEIDDFHIHGREVFWLCLHRQSKSAFSNAVLEKTIGGKATLRGINTIRKMAEKHRGSPLRADPGGG